MKTFSPLAIFILSSAAFAGEEAKTKNQKLVRQIFGPEWTHFRFDQQNLEAQRLQDSEAEQKRLQGMGYIVMPHDNRKVEGRFEGGSFILRQNKLHNPSGPESWNR